MQGLRNAEWINATLLHHPRWFGHVLGVPKHWRTLTVEQSKCGFGLYAIPNQRYFHHTRNTTSLDTETTLRRARPEDMPDLIRMCAEHAAYERADYSPSGKAEALAAMLFMADARLNCLVVAGNVGLLGYATFSVEVSTWDADRYMHMDCLFLRPEARNKGVGRVLMRRIAQEAIAQGVWRMQWQTPSFNVDAIRFYDRLGPVKKEKFRMFLDEAKVKILAG